MLNRFFNVTWVIVFSMLLSKAIIEGDTLWIVINSLILLVDSAWLIYDKKK